MPRKIQRYGWVPDLPDPRDFMYAAPPQLIGALPPSADLRSGCPPVYDQGQLGSCTANAIGGAFEFEQKKQGLPEFIPSRLFIYYNERDVEGSVSSDSGARIRDGIKTVVKLGVCPETEWPYDITKFTQKPPQTPCYVDAAQNKVLTYQRVPQAAGQLKACLAAGYPFVFGFTVYESFESDAVAKTGILQMPAPSEAQVGGHAVTAVGYDDAQSRFLVRNSWGAAWGMAGYFTMPYAYVTDHNYADDFWTIRGVTSQGTAAQGAAAH